MSYFSRDCVSGQLKPCTPGNWCFSKHCPYRMCKSCNCCPLVMASLSWTESVTAGFLRLSHTSVFWFSFGMVTIFPSKFSLSSSLIFLGGWPCDSDSSSFSWQQSSSLLALVISALSVVSSFSRHGISNPPCTKSREYLLLPQTVAKIFPPFIQKNTAYRAYLSGQVSDNRLIFTFQLRDFNREWIVAVG